jgi:tRNA A37 threonylcarbamoyladenosine dehydratase
MVIGEAGLEKLKGAHVAIFGVGGVGSFSAEALARAGVGRLTLVDFDRIALTNLNRQLHALETTIGQYKVDVMKERLLTINPEMEINAVKLRYDAESSEEIFADGFDFVIDAIDMVTSKIHLIVTCDEKNIPMISSMGTGNKLDPTQLEIADLYKTSVCPLAKVMRKELKAKGIRRLAVVYSTELPVEPLLLDPNPANPRKVTPGSISFVPPVSGFFMASYVVRELLK